MAKKYDELAPIARNLFHRALLAARIEEDVWRHAILTMQISGNERVFTLILPGDRPEDAQVICRVVIDAMTGKHSTVELLPAKCRQ